MARLTPDDYGYAIEVNKDLQDLIKSKKYKYFINGHTHYKMVRSLGNLININAGTLRRDNEPSFLIVDFAKKIVQFYNFNKKSIIEKAETVNLTENVYFRPDFKPKNFLKRIIAVFPHLKY